MAEYFRHADEDENTGTSHELLVTSEPPAYLDITIRVEAPRAKSSALFRLPRYRVRALHHMLGEWLEATKEWDICG
jgi:hypothetical protein